MTSVSRATPLIRCRAALYGAVFVLLVTLPLGRVALADSRTYSIGSGVPNAVVFSVEDNVDPFDGKTANVSGTIVADPAAPSDAHVEVSIDLASLDTANSLRNQHLRERYLQTDRFPAATFKSVSINASSPIAPNQPPDITVTGDFSLHRVTNRNTIPHTVTPPPD